MLLSGMHVLSGGGWTGATVGEKIPEANAINPEL